MGVGVVSQYHISLLAQGWGGDGHAQDQDDKAAADDS